MKNVSSFIKTYLVYLNISSPDLISGNASSRINNNDSIKNFIPEKSNSENAAIHISGCWLNEFNLFPIPSPKSGKENYSKNDLQKYLKQQKLSLNRIKQYYYAFHQLKLDTFVSCNSLQGSSISLVPPHT